MGTKDRYEGWSAGEILAYRRQRKRHYQTDSAVLLGVDPSTISRLETGQLAPGRVLATKIFRLYGRPRPEEWPLPDEVAG